MILSGCGFYGLYLSQKGQPVIIYFLIWARIIPLILYLLPLCFCVFIYRRQVFCGESDSDEGGETEDDRYHKHAFIL